MRKLKLSLLALSVGISAMQYTAFAADNPMLDADFWKGANLAKVEEAIAQGNSATDISSNLFTPLMNALRNDTSVEVVDFLIKNGADINRKGHDGRPPIFWAAYGSGLPVVKHLVELGADTGVLDDSDRSVLGFAAFNQKDPAVLKYLMDDLGMNPNDADDAGRNAALCAAYLNPNLDIVNMLSKLADIKALTEDGENAFMLAAYRNKNPEVVKEMMAIVDDPKATNEKGEDALARAAIRNNLKVVDFLLSQGFDPKNTNKDGRDALSLAAYRNGADVVGKFIELGLDVNAKDKDGKTPLMYAAYRNSPEVVALLLEKGADVNVKDDNNNTALIEAGLRDRKGADEIIDMLLTAGADAKVVNKKGTNALVASARNGHALDSLKKLVKGGADINAVDNDRMSALMYLALKSNNPDAVAYLLDSGAKTDFADDFGDTAADMIKENKSLADTDVAKRLTQ